MLLQAGASTALKDADGYTALEYAAAREAGIQPFFPIPSNPTSEAFAAVRSRSEVELYILRRRNDELDEEYAATLPAAERDRFEEEYKALSPEAKQKLELFGERWWEKEGQKDEV